MFKNKEENKNQKVFVIYDAKAELYNRPMTAPTTGAMVRQFADLANDKNHPMGQHPEDYILFEIADFDDYTGAINVYKAPKSLGKAIDFKKPDTPVMDMKNG